MTIAERLRNLDRQVGAYRQPTPKEWIRTARGWRSSLASACFIAALVVAFSLFVPQAAAGASFMAFIAVGIAFHAGQMKVEHDRLRGEVEHVGGFRRADGL